MSWTSKKIKYTRGDFYNVEIIKCGIREGTNRKS